MRRYTIWWRARGWAIGAIAMLTLCGSLFWSSAAPAASATAPPAARGMARIWFYRDYEPSVSLNLANVALNGAPAATVQFDGSAVYRDVPAGHYEITVESYGRDMNQSKSIDLAPGQEAFVKILSLSAWVSDGDKASYQRDTFYVSLVPPQVARDELAAHPLSGG